MFSCPCTFAFAFTYACKGRKKQRCIHTNKHTNIQTRQRLTRERGVILKDKRYQKCKKEKEKREREREKREREKRERERRERERERETEREREER